MFGNCYNSLIHDIGSKHLGWSLWIQHTGSELHNRTSSPNKESYFRKRLKRSWYPAVSRSRASRQWVDIGRRFSDNWSFGTWLRTCIEERTDEREKHHLVKKIIRLCGRIFTTSLFCGQSPIYAECFFETLRFPFLSCLSLFFIPTKILKGKLVKMETFGNSFKRGVLKKSHRFENASFLEWILVSGGGGKAFLRYRP